MTDFGRDLRLAVRGAFRRPGYSLAVIATLAIGIGANTAIFSVFNWLLFRPVPGVHNPGELVTLRFQMPKSDARFFVSYSDYVDLRDGVKALSGLAASWATTVNLAAADHVDPQRIEAELVTTNYFTVLGARPAPGRGFAPAEEQPGSNTPPAIISRALWQRIFSSDPTAIGRPLTVNGHAFTVVGIAPAGFTGPSLTSSTEIWLPVGAHEQVLADRSGVLTNRRRTLFIEAIGRLRPGTTVAQAQEQASATAESIVEFAGRPAGGKRPVVRPKLYAGLGYDTFAKERLTTIFKLLMGSVGLVLLLACANAANLLLARAVGRRREIAVCQAIGASRFQIVRQQLAEGLVLSLAAGIAGLFLAIWLTSLFDGMRILTFLPSVKGVGVDWRVGAFTLVVAMSTGLLFALAPALVTSRVDLQSWLKDGLTASRQGRPLLRGALAAIQVAVSIVLLVGAGLFITTLGNIRALDLGMTVDGVVNFMADPSRQGYTPERSQQYFRDVLARLGAVPGVHSAAYSFAGPFSGARSEMAFTRADARDKPFEAVSSTVTADYFTTLQIPMLAGRDFTDAEYLRASSETIGVAIVSQRTAREVFPEGRAVGSRIVLDYPKGMVLEIVGIVGDVRGRPVTADPEPYIYEPAGQRWAATWGAVHVRSALPFAQTAAAVRDVARALDQSLPPYDVEPFGASIDRTVSEQRLFARLSAIFAGVAALLAAVGIYGMMAGAVSERRREFGIRLALGARASSVLALVVRGALAVSAVGLVAGLGGAIALRRTVESRLFGVTGVDPATIAMACVTLLSLAVAASLIPAVRASRVDPVTALRVD